MQTRAWAAVLVVALCITSAFSASVPVNPRAFFYGFNPMAPGPAPMQPSASPTPVATTIAASTTTSRGGGGGGGGGGSTTVAAPTSAPTITTPAPTLAGGATIVTVPGQPAAVAPQGNGAQTISTGPVSSSAPISTVAPVAGSTTSPSISGTAYDGYLNNCQIYMDSNGNKTYDAGETYTTTSLSLFKTAGVTFALPQPPILGNTYVIPAIPGGARSVDTTAASPPCYDAATLLKNYIPLATPPLTAAAVASGTRMVISPFSTLLVYGNYSSGLLASDILTAFGLTSTNIVIGQYDALNAASSTTNAGSASTGTKVLKAEIQLQNFVVALTNLLANPAKISTTPSIVAQISVLSYKWIAAQINAVNAIKAVGNSTTSGRRLLQTDSVLTAIPFNLSDPSTLGAVASNVQASAAADPTLGAAINTVSAADIAAAATAISTINNLAANAANLTALQTVSLVSATTLGDALAGLGNGTVNATAFAAATSPSALSAAVAATVLPGVVVPLENAAPAPAPAASGSSGLSGGAIAGIVIGVVAGVAILALIAYVAMTQRARRAAGGAAQPMFAQGGGYENPAPAPEDSYMNPRPASGRAAAAAV